MSLRDGIKRGRRGSKENPAVKKIRRMKIDDEEVGYKSSMKYNHSHYDDIEGKTPDFNFGPIKRYLQSKIGCNWDDVYAELCNLFQKESWFDIHWRDYILWNIENPTDLDRIWYRDCYYLDENNTLCIKKAGKKKFSNTPTVTHRKISDTEYLIQHNNGQWFRITYSNRIAILCDHSKIGSPKIEGENILEELKKYCYGYNDHYVDYSAKKYIPLRAYVYRFESSNLYLDKPIYFPYKNFKDVPYMRIDYYPIELKQLNRSEKKQYGLYQNN